MDQLKFFNEMQALSKALNSPDALSESEKPKDALDVLKQMHDIRAKVYNMCFDNKSASSRAIDVLRYLQRVRHFLNHLPESNDDDNVGQEYMDVLHLISSSEPLSEAEQPKCEWDLLNQMFSIQQLIPGFYQQSQRLSNSKTLFRFLKQVEFFLRRSEASKAAPQDPIAINVAPTVTPTVAPVDPKTESKLELMIDPNNKTGYIFCDATSKFLCKIGSTELHKMIKHSKLLILLYNQKDNDMDTDSDITDNEKLIYISKILSLTIKVNDTSDETDCDLIEFIFDSYRQNGDDYGSDSAMRYKHGFKTIKDLKTFVKQCKQTIIKNNNNQ